MSKKELSYQTKDKVYKTKPTNKKRVLKKGALLKLLIIPCLLILIVSILLIKDTIEIDGKIENVGYNEIGNADYKVYLKENNYYDSKYLDSNMQYVASLISSINTKFNYEIHSDENIDYTYTYKISGDLIIHDKNDENKVLYKKKYNLLEEKQETLNSNNLVINKDLDIDYDEYNNYVNSYKRDYGISADSKLIVTMDIKVDGIYEEAEEKLSHKNQLQIEIPLSEQTLNIDIKSDEINQTGTLSTPIGTTIINKPVFALGLTSLIISLIGLAVSIWLWITYRKVNIYTVTLHRFLRDYDRIIVNATDNIEEGKFKRVITVSSFAEIVDAAQNNATSIVFFEAIPGQKSFFLVIKGDTLYKYRLTKAYLDGNPEAEELKD